MNGKWTALSGAVFAAVLAAAPIAAHAEDWKPQRPIEIIAPAGPGGGWDLLSRTMQKALTEEKLVDRPVITSYSIHYTKLYEIRLRRCARGTLPCTRAARRRRVR